MTPQTSTADEDLALELGAKLVRKDGTVFNAAGRSGVTRLPVSQTKPTPAPVVSPAPAQDNGPLIQALQDMVAKMQPAPAPEITIPAPVVTVHPTQRVLEWTFTFERNGDGTIKSIKAKAA